VISGNQRWLIGIMTIVLIAFLPMTARMMNGGDFSTHLAMVHSAPIVTPTPTLKCTRAYDDFSDPTSGWIEWDTEQFDMRYDNGEYRILLKAPIRRFVNNGEIGWVSGSLSASADMRWESPNGHAYGLVFSQSVVEGSSNYAVYIEPGLQQYWVEYWSQQTGTVLVISPTISTAIHAGTETNHLLIRKIQNQATIIINDIEVDTFMIQNSGAEFQVAVGVNGLPDYPESASRFDNFCIHWENNRL
jgi:hypothetical protein